MNFHTDDWIIQQVQAHYNEALNYFDERSIVGIFLQGSQNYGLDTPDSDIDTKLITLPSLDDIVFNRKAISWADFSALYLLAQVKIILIIWLNGG